MHQLVHLGRTPKRSARLHLLLAGALLLLTGCCTTTIQVGKAGQIRGSKDSAEKVESATKRAGDVYANPAFWALVKRRSFLASPSASHPTSGADVAAQLDSVSPNEAKQKVGHIFSCLTWLAPFWNGSCNASTSSCTEDAPRCGVVHLNVRYVDEADVAYLVNTVAHEVTHLLGDGKGDCGCQGSDGPLYADGGYSNAHVPWLVSYAIGDLAQCFDAADGDSAKAEVCFASTVNGSRCNRAIAACCPGEADPKEDALTGLKKLRDASPMCRKVRCPAKDRVACGSQN